MEENMQKTSPAKSLTRSALTAGVLAIVSSMGAYAADGGTASTVKKATNAKASVSSSTDTTTTSASDTTVTPASDTTATSASDTTATSASDTTATSASDTTATSASDTTVTPASDTTATSASDTTATPAPDTTSTPVSDSTATPASDSAVVAKSETTATAPDVQPTTSMVPAESSASSALKQKSTDATTAKNLNETFTASERQYSLSKQGSYSLIYDLGYSYYANTALDLALDSSSSTITRLRIQNNAQHAITNTFTLQYGLLNNLTVTASLPMVAKYNPPTATTTAGLGDVNFGARWEPFPLGTTPLPITLFGTLTTPTGDSPYDINPLTDLSTGQGYYSLGGGISTRKFIDPIVLFGTLSMNYGLDKSGLNYVSGNRILTNFTPGYTTGIGFGFAYSLNYDVSLTMSYQQSFVFGSQFQFNDGTISRPANSSAATLNSSLGIRVSPTTIVNVSLGFGLTPDSPNVVLGLSLPLDFLGLGRVVK
jgi:hypothetical protein